MKSIEALQYLDDIAHGRIMDYDPHELKLIVEKDLEVLEIIRKKKVDIDYLYCLYTWYRDYNYENPIVYTLEKYNCQLEFNRQITQKEFTKIIQWLEEKKHDNKDGTDI